MSRNDGIVRIGLVAKARLREAADLLDGLVRWLHDRGVRTAMDPDTAALCHPTPESRVMTKDELPAAVDLVLVLGGDGTLLGMADRIAQAGADIPILGVNFGSLGFLTEITLDELYPSLEAALAGAAAIEHRLMLAARTTRATAPPVDRLVLNDVVITKGALSRIIELAVWVDDQFVTHVRADGLIVASPTGSTAYNLAAGGPIVHPAVDAIVLTPIAPHTLTNRPVVIPAASVIRLEPHVEASPSEVFVTFDGQTGFTMGRGDSVTISRAERPLRLIKASARSYFEVIQQKLKWGGR
jgi:NAD+ kinase